MRIGCSASVTSTECEAMLANMLELPSRPSAQGRAAPGAAGEVDVDEGLPVGIVAADGDPGVAAVGGGEDPVRQHHREAAEGAVDHAKAGEAARRAGRRQHGVGDRAGRCDHLDRAEHALVVRDVGRQHRADRGVARGLGVGVGVVDRALDLRVGAGPVDQHVVALLGHRDEQPDRLVEVDAVVVDPVLEAPLAVGQFARAPRGSGARRGRRPPPSAR